MTIVSSPPNYPPTSDMGYAAWLRHFAAHLPPLATRYHICPTEVASVQRIAAEFTDWLIYRVHQATQLLLTRQNPEATTFQSGPAPPIPQDLFLLDRVAVLVQRIRYHPAYRPADGSTLGFAMVELASPGRAHHPPPLRLRLDPRPPGAAPVLRWAGRCGATLELEVCRDGLVWLPLTRTSGSSYEDSCRQPPVPLQWQYRARYRWADRPPGRWTRVLDVEVGLGYQLAGS